MTDKLELIGMVVRHCEKLREHIASHMSSGVQGEALRMLTYILIYLGASSQHDEPRLVAKEMASELYDMYKGLFGIIENSGEEG